MNPKRIILACRSLEKARAASSTLKAETKYSSFEEWELDLASFASVRAFAKRFLEEMVPLDILVSNAGIASVASWVETVDGHEVT